MASKRLGASAIPKTTISSPVVQIPQQKPRSPPPSPPPSLTLKDLQDALAQNSLLMAQKTEQLLKQNNEDFCENLAAIFQGLASHVDRIEGRVDELEEKVDLNEHRLERVEESVDIAQNDIILGQFREMEYAVRIRGLMENSKENLREEIASALAVELACKQEIIYDEIEKAYRINSWIAHQRNLPRDVVVYFTRKTRRNEILQRFYQQRFRIAAQDVILLKEIPPKILRKRKDFAFLAQELKKRQMIFRWDIPMGIVLTYAGIRYRLNTVKKAKDFFVSVLQADLPPSPRAERTEELSEQLVVELPGASASGGESLQLTEGKNAKEQRMTRAAYRRREKEQQKEIVSPPSLTSQPVGGARPKTSVSADVFGLFQKLSKPKDG